MFGVVTEFVSKFKLTGLYSDLEIAKKYTKAPSTYIQEISDNAPYNYGKIVHNTTKYDILDNSTPVEMTTKYK